MTGLFTMRLFLSVMLLSACTGCVRVRLPEAKVGPGPAVETLSWEQAVDLTLRYHPDVLKAQADLRSAAHARNAAFGDYLPDVDGSFIRKHSRTTSTAAGADSMSFDLDVTQPLFAGGAVTGEFLQAKREWEAARFAYRETSADVRQRLRASFAELLRQEALEDTTRRIAERRQENADLLQLRYNAGREHRGSLLRAQAIAEEAAFELRQAQRRTDTQRLTFGRELGGRVWMGAHLSENLEQLTPQPPALPEDYAALAEGTPTVQRLVKTAESLKAAILSTQADLWPSVDGTFNYGYSGTDVNKLRDDASVGVTVSVPLFAGGANVQDVLGARQDYRAAVETARSARDARIASLSSAWSAFRDAREFVDVRRKFLEAARERGDIVREQYRSGLASFQDFDIAEQELADAEKRYVDSLADVLIREAAWEAAEGSTLEEVPRAK